MLCRLCLKCDPNLKENIISSKLKCSELTLIDCLYWIFGVDVDVNDPYSKFICVPCEKVIQYVGSYRTLYRKNQLILEAKSDQHLLDEWMDQISDEDNELSNTTTKCKSRQTELSPRTKKSKRDLIEYYYDIPTTAIRELIKGKNLETNNHERFDQVKHTENNDGLLFQVNEEVTVEVCNYCSQIFTTKQHLNLHCNTEHKSLKSGKLNGRQRSRRTPIKKTKRKNGEHLVKPDPFNNLTAKYPLLYDFLNQPIAEKHAKKFLFDLGEFPNLNFVKKLDKLNKRKGSRKFKDTTQKDVSGECNGLIKDVFQIESFNKNREINQRAKTINCSTSLNKQNLATHIESRYEHLQLKDFHIPIKRCAVPVGFVLNSKATKQKSRCEKEHSSQKLQNKDMINSTAEKVIDSCIENLMLPIKTEPEDFEIMEDELINISDSGTGLEDLEASFETEIERKPVLLENNTNFVVDKQNRTRNVQEKQPNPRDASISVEKCVSTSLRHSNDLDLDLPPVLVKEEPGTPTWRENLSTSILRIQDILKIEQDQSGGDQPCSEDISTTMSNRNRYMTRQFNSAVTSQDASKKSDEVKSNTNQIKKTRSRSKTKKRRKPKGRNTKNKERNKPSEIKDVIVSLPRMDPVLRKVNCDNFENMPQLDQITDNRCPRKTRRKTISVALNMPRLKREIDFEIKPLETIEDEPPELELQVPNMPVLRKRDCFGRVAKPPPEEKLGSRSVPYTQNKAGTSTVPSNCGKRTRKVPVKKETKTGERVDLVNELLNSMTIIDIDRNGFIKERVNKTETDHDGEGRCLMHSRGETSASENNRLCTVKQESTPHTNSYFNAPKRTNNKSTKSRRNKKATKSKINRNINCGFAQENNPTETNCQGTNRGNNLLKNATCLKNEVKPTLSSSVPLNKAGSSSSFDVEAIFDSLWESIFKDEQL